MNDEQMDAFLQAGGYLGPANPGDAALALADDGAVNYFQKHSMIIDMFPNLDHAKIFPQYGHMSSEALAGYIVEHLDQMPKKQKMLITDTANVNNRGVKRKANQKMSGPADDEDDEVVSDEEFAGEFLVDKMLLEMTKTIRTEMANRAGDIGLNKAYNAKELLAEKFPNVRLDFIKTLFRSVSGNLVVAAFGCFLCQSGHSEYLKRAVFVLTDSFYLRQCKPMEMTRKSKAPAFTAQVLPEIEAAYKRFIELMLEYEQKYPELLTGIRLRLQASNVRYEPGEEEGRLECLVCYDLFPVSRMVFCQQSELLGSELLMNDGVGGNNAETSNSQQQSNEREEAACFSDSHKPSTSGTLSASEAGKVEEMQMADAIIESMVDNLKQNGGEQIPVVQIKSEVIELDDEEEFDIQQDDDIKIVFEKITIPPAFDKRANADNDDEKANDDIESLASSSSQHFHQTYCATATRADGDTVDDEIDFLGTSSHEAFVNPKIPCFLFSKKGERDVESQEIDSRLTADDDELDEEENDGHLSKSVLSTTVQLEPVYHAFCRNCIRGQAQAATTDIPLGSGGLGLKCMMPDCQHILRYGEIRHIIPSGVRKKLEERILEENIGMAHLINLERCRKCNFAMEMGVPPEVNKVFDCYGCGAKTCRICDRDWDEDHFGLSCEELDKKMNHDRKQRALEARMNEAVVRRCPRCGLAFVKESGCNKMTCRCKMTMCYICRATGINYEHFCQHVRDPRVKNWKCNECSKTCLLHEDASKRDASELEKISREEVESKASNAASDVNAEQAAAQAEGSNNNAQAGLNLPIPGFVLPDNIRIIPDANLPQVPRLRINRRVRRANRRLFDEHPRFGDLFVPADIGHGPIFTPNDGAVNQQQLQQANNNPHQAMIADRARRFGIWRPAANHPPAPPAYHVHYHPPPPPQPPPQPPPLPQQNFFGPPADPFYNYNHYEYNNNAAIAGGGRAVCGGGFHTAVQQAAAPHRMDFENEFATFRIPRPRWATEGIDRLRREDARPDAGGVSAEGGDGNHARNRAEFGLGQAAYRPFGTNDVPAADVLGLPGGPEFRNRARDHAEFGFGQTVYRPFTTNNVPADLFGLPAGPGFGGVRPNHNENFGGAPQEAELANYHRNEPVEQRREPAEGARDGFGAGFGRASVKTETENP